MSVKEKNKAGYWHRCPDEAIDSIGMRYETLYSSFLYLAVEPYWDVLKKNVKGGIGYYWTFFNMTIRWCLTIVEMNLEKLKMQKFDPEILQIDIELNKF